MATHLFINFHSRKNFSTSRKEISGLPLFNEKETDIQTWDKVALFFIRHNCYRIAIKAELLPEVQEALSGRNNVIHEEIYGASSSRLKDNGECGLTYARQRKRKK